MATANVDGRVRLWDLETHAPCITPLQHKQMAMSVCFSPDGKWLASGGFEGTIKIWRVPNQVSDLREMELRTSVALGFSLDDAGVVRPIPWREWQQRREELRAREPR